LSLGEIGAALVARHAQDRTPLTLDQDVQALDRLVGWLRRLVAADDPATVAVVLARVEEAPRGHAHLHELALALNRRATSDIGFRSDLEALIDHARASTLDIDSITRGTWGNHRL